jgi:hypothetical protein
LPVGYTIDNERRLVITTGSGRVTFAEVKAQYDQILSDPAFDPEFNQLIDGTAITTLDLSVDEVRTIVQRKVFSPVSRRALVATLPAVFGTLRMAGTYHEVANASPAEICVFHDIPSASKWLASTDPTP